MLHAIKAVGTTTALATELALVCSIYSTLRAFVQ